jgi:hypothetical protein
MVSTGLFDAVIAPGAVRTVIGALTALPSRASSPPSRRAPTGVSAVEAAQEAQAAIGSGLQVDVTRGRERAAGEDATPRLDERFNGTGSRAGLPRSRARA